MSKSAKSVYIFSLYLFVLGVTLLIAPNAMLGFFGVAPTTEVWIRVAAMLTLLIGFYYFMAARAELIPFFRWTVYARLSVIVFLTAFVLLKMAEPTLIMFGAFDLLGALYTFMALRAEKHI